MRRANTSLTNYLASRPNQVIAPDCFVIYLPGYSLTNPGTPLLYTNADVDVALWSLDYAIDGYNGVTAGAARIVSQTIASVPYAVFKSNAVRIEGLKFSTKVGLGVDEQDITIGVGQTAAEQVLGVNFLAALRLGLLDNALVQRIRVYMTNFAGTGGPWTASWKGTTSNSGLRVGIGGVTLFYGRIAQVEEVGRLTAKLKLKDLGVLLDGDFPRNVYQDSCLWKFGDQGCGVNLSRLMQSGAVGGAPSYTFVPWTGAVGNLAPGTITFTSGILAGEVCGIKNTDPTGLTLTAPMTSLPTLGDGFTAQPECDLTRGPNGCVRFNNLGRFRGFPYVPAATLAI